MGGTEQFGAGGYFNREAHNSCGSSSAVRLCIYFVPTSCCNPIDRDAPDEES